MFMIFTEIFVYVVAFHAVTPWMGHIACVFVAGMHLSTTWLSDSFESVCVRAQTRPKFILSLSSKRVVGRRENAPKPDGSEKGRIHESAPRRTVNRTDYELSYSGPRPSFE